MKCSVRSLFKNLVMIAKSCCEYKPTDIFPAKTKSDLSLKFVQETGISCLHIFDAHYTSVEFHKKEPASYSYNNKIIYILHPHHKFYLYFITKPI